MKQHLIRFLGLLALFTLLVGYELGKYPGGFAQNKLLAIQIITGVSLFMTGGWWFMDERFIPLRRKQLVRKLEKVLNATAVNDRLVAFTFNRLRFYALLNLRMQASEIRPYRETISVYLRRPAPWLESNPDFKLKEATVNGEACFMLFEISAFFINSIPGRINRKLKLRPASS